MENQLPEELKVFVDMYHSDEDFRDKVRADPIGVLEAHGIPLDDDFSFPGVDLAVSADTGEIVNFVLPPDPNSSLSDEALVNVHAGSTASSAGTVGCLGTFACICFPMSLGSAGTASSAGSRG